MRKKATKYLILGIAITFLFSLTPGLATEFDVSTSSDFQDALSEAGSNGMDDTIILAPGVYVTDSQFSYSASEPDSSLTIQGAGRDSTFLEASVNSDQQSILELYGLGPGLQYNCTLKGITIRDGSIPMIPKRGLLINIKQGIINLENCAFTNNASSLIERHKGGVVLLSYGGTINLTDNLFSSCDGIKIDTDDNFCEIQFQSNIFLHNKKNAGGGASLSIDEGNIMLRNNSFRENKALDLRGGGFLCSLGSGDITMNYNEFQGNEAEEFGGAAFISVNSGDIIFSSNTLRENKCKNANLRTLNHGNLEISSNIFDSNKAENNSAIDSFIQEEGSIEISNNLFFQNNSSIEPCIIYLYSKSNLYLINNTFTDNIDPSVLSGACLFLWLESTAGGQAFIHNNIFWNNTPDIFDIHCIGERNDTLLLSHNNYRECCFSQFDGTIEEHDNRNEDPRFVSSTDFHLSPFSNLINIGNNDAPALPEYDIEGNTRVQGGTVDLGAYESSLIPPEVVDPDNPQNPDTNQDSDKPSPSGGGGGGGCSTTSLPLFLFIFFLPLLFLKQRI